MVVEVRQIQPNAYLLYYVGRVKVPELEKAYREVIALEDMTYLLADGSEMIYSDEVLLSESLAALIPEMVKPDSVKRIFLVAPENHPIRELTLQFYDSIGYLHKIQFVLSQAEGIKLINELLKK